MYILRSKPLGVLTDWIRSNYIAILVFSAPLFFRIYINTLGYHVDLLSIAPWGDWIFDHGAKGFYKSEGWILSGPTQPPLAHLFNGFISFAYFQILEIFRYLSYHVVPYLAGGHMLWWFNFVIWFDTAKYPVTDISLGYLLVMKLPAMLSDLCIAFIIYIVARSNNIKNSIVWPFIFLVSPFSWYISALWGQYDQLGFLFLLISFLLIYKRYFIFAPTMFLISMELKPTSLVFIPLFCGLYFYIKPKIYQIAAGILLAFVVFTVSIIPFTDQNPFVH